VKVERECLTNEELTAIEKKEFGIPRLRFVRDLFVFGCYTGLAYINVMGLDRSCITMGIDGGLWLSTTRKKTTTEIAHALNKNKWYRLFANYTLPNPLFHIPIWNRWMNVVVKEVFFQ
jgi:hypothetical protein